MCEAIAVRTLLRRDRRLDNTDRVALGQYWKAVCVVFEIMTIDSMSNHSSLFQFLFRFPPVGDAEGKVGFLSETGLLS
jgi:hypothetical protein